MFIVAIAFKIFLAIVTIYSAFSLGGIAIDWLKRFFERLRP